MSADSQLLTSFPMQSNFTGFDEYGNPLYDRAVDALFYRNFWKKYFTNGIFSVPSDNFKVSPHAELKVKIKLGGAHIQGVTCLPETETELIIQLKESTTSDRVDRIVLRADFEDARKISIEIYEGWKTTDSLKRNTNFWELALADVTVRKNVSVIQSENITDLRLNSELCGIVSEPVERVNSTEFFSQIQNMRENIQTQWNAQLQATVNQSNNQHAFWNNQMDNQAEEHSQQLESQQSQWLSQMENQNSHWASQTGEQQEDFDVQLQSQSENYTVLKEKIENWYNDSRANIANLQIFDFENMFSYPGGLKTTVFDPSGSIIQSISLPGSGKLIAQKQTDFLENGAIQAVLRTYKEDGELKEERIVTTRFAADGSILEEVI